MIAFVLLVLFIDWYAFQAVRTVFDAAPLYRNPAVITYWGISLAIYILIAVGITSYFQLSPIHKRLIMGAVICIGVAKLFMVSILLVDDAGRLARWIASLFNGSGSSAATGRGISRSEFLNRAALLAGGAMFGLFAWGMISTAYRYKVRRLTVKLPQLPDGFSGLKIVQISDLHLGSFISTEPVEQAVRKINELEADLVFFTGDLVNSTASEAEPFVKALSGIRARYGVYSILGNHDYGKYHRWTSLEEEQDNMDRLKAVHSNSGWTLLNNEHRLLDIDGVRIAVAGVENWGASRHFPKVGDVSKALDGAGHASVKLLLSHDPSHWNYKVSKEHPEVDITFSGHTHGFQMGVEIPWLNLKWSPSQYVYKQWAGLYRQGSQYLYVNRGLGFIGYHGRVGILPEITLMELQQG